MTDIVRTIHAAQPDRSLANIGRRLIKLLEEQGEIAEAWLNVTSPANAKQKTWGDVREEAADALIVLLDVALTDVPLSYVAETFAEALRAALSAPSDDGARNLRELARHLGPMLVKPERPFEAVLPPLLQLCLIRGPGEGRDGRLADLERLVSLKVPKWTAARGRTATDGTDD